MSAIKNETALLLTAAHKRFDDAIAMNDVHLNVRSSDILALVGPSGCGKTTLLRSIAGLTGLDSGTIHLAGILVDDSKRRIPPEKRQVGLVFQEHSLFPHLTVLENIAFGIRDTSRSAIRTRTNEALELVKLELFANRYPHELSGGERQRVALARALAPRPTLMLLDEPFANLDPNLRGELRHDVIDALRETQTPAVLVTHDQNEALASGDRVAIMRSGEIQQQGNPDTVFHEPRNRFVAAFMGEASFLPLVITPSGASTLLGPVSIDSGKDLRPGCAMVRPDDLIFTADPSGDSVIHAREFRGMNWNYQITLSDGTVVSCSSSHRQQLEVGTRGRITLAPGHNQVLVNED